MSQSHNMLKKDMLKRFHKLYCERVGITFISLKGSPRYFDSNIHSIFLGRRHKYVSLPLAKRHLFLCVSRQN